MMLVVDASAIAPLALSDEDAGFGNAVLRQIEADGFATVPPLFWEELQNIFVVAERRGRINADETDRFLSEVKAAIAWRTHVAAEALSSLRLARQYGLSAYDACYLNAALEIGATLATLDRELQIAAVAAGVAVFDVP